MFCFHHDEIENKACLPLLKELQVFGSETNENGVKVNCENQFAYVGLHKKKILLKSLFR